ncbi:MAG: hypothetical protein WA892_07125 [Ornithinimicrobium sp.]
MNLAEAMALIVPPVNDLKRRSQARSDGETTLFPTLVVLRDDRVVAAVTTPRLEATLACAATIAVGLAPQMLALAAQVTLPGGSDAIAYTTMTEDHRAALAVQTYSTEDEHVTFGTPERGDPDDRSIMDQLAAALNLAPLDSSAVATGPAQPRPGDASTPTGREPARIPPERGRMVIDSGTCASLHRSVAGIGGTVMFLPTSAEHARDLLEHGMPQEVLLQPPSSGP